MKILLALSLALFFHLSAIGAEPLKWIVITTETTWPDGRGSEVGEIEVVLSETASDYVTWAENGQKYNVPKTNAKAISAEDAAMMLIQKRQALYEENHKLLDELTSPAATADARKTTGERARERKAKRDAAAKASVDSYYEWKLRNFLDRQR